MTRVLTSLLTAFILALGPALATHAAARPNIIFIMADDLGFSDLGCYGGEIATPNLDHLAAHGLRFTQFYNTGRCWPSRAALLTGYYAQQVNRDPAGQRPPWAALLPQFLKQIGYRSYHSGKWHVDGPVLAGGFERSYLVVDQDRFFSPRQHSLDDKPLPQPAPDSGYYATTAIADRAIEWMGNHASTHKESPFFLYLAYTAPHFPLQALPEDIQRYKNRYQDGWDRIREARFRRIKNFGWFDGALPPLEPDTVPSWNLPENQLRERIGPSEAARAIPWAHLTPEQKEFQATKMAIHAAMIDRMDRELGRVLAQLRKMGAFENTIIFFASDNGASAEQIIRGDGHDPAEPPGCAKCFLGLGPSWSTAANTPFRKHKSWVHEGGVCTPFIVHWPAQIKASGQWRHTPAHLVDIVPTIFEITGFNPPEQWTEQTRPPLPGRSLVPTFAKGAAIPRENVFFKHQGNRALRAGDWKIVAAGPGGEWELYNLASDRAEMKNLAADHPGKLREMTERWTALDQEYARQGASGRKDATKPQERRK